MGEEGGRDDFKEFENRNSVNLNGGWSNQPVDSLPTVDSNSNQVKFEFLHFKSGHGDGIVSNCRMYLC